MLDFSGKRWWYLSISLAFFLLSAGAMAIFGLRPGIEFTSGSSFMFQFTEQEVRQEDLRSAMSDLGYSEARIQGAGQNTFLIRTRELENSPAFGAIEGPVPPGEIDTIEQGLEARFGAIVRSDFSTVSSTVSTEIARYATIAVIVAALAILLYISFAFRRVPKPFRYGTCAVIALAHDSFLILGLFAILGQVRGTEVDTAFLTALLTVIGFSVHDTIVVFDRIRETVSNDPFIPFEEAVNASLTETLGRSLNTSFTVVVTILALLLIGGVTIRNFLLVLLIGVIAGTYSSIGVAAQVLVVWENNDIGRFMRRLRGRPEEPELEPA
jgi:preprotein translocase subunit SecF